MRSMGVRTALYLKIVQLLQRFPVFRGKEVTSNDILYVYLQMHRMQNLADREFGVKLEHLLGAGTSRTSSELSALRKLMRSLSLEELFRFVCVDLIGNPKGAFEALEYKDLETSLYCIAKAGEEDWDFTSRYSLYDIPLINDGILSSEKFAALQRSVQNMVIRNDEFLEGDTIDDASKELREIYSDVKQRTNLILRTYRATSAKFKPREISIELYEKVRSIDPLDFLESFYAETDYNQMKFETGLVYEAISSSIDISDHSEHVVLLEPSLYFVKRWFSDHSLNSVDTSFVFTDSMIHDFVRVRAFWRKRGSLTNVVTPREWYWAFQQGWWGKLKRASRLYANLTNTDWTRHTIKQFTAKHMSGLKDQATLFLFCSSEDTKSQEIEFDIVPAIAELRLAAYGFIESKQKGGSTTRFLVRYVKGETPVYEHFLPQQPVMFFTDYYEDDVLVSSNLARTRVNENLLSLTPPRVEVPTHALPAKPSHAVERRPETVVFSPEISFRMRKIFEGKTLKRISVYCRTQSVIRTRKHLGMKAGKEIPGTLLSRVFSDIEAARDWAVTEYPYENTPKYKHDKGKDFPKTVREAISREYCELLRSSDSTLRGFHYTHPKLESGLSMRKKTLLIDIMLSDVGLNKISECSVERLSDALVAQVEDLSPEDINERLGLIHAVLKHAVEMKCTEMNMLATWAGEVQRVINRRRQARAALGKNSLRLYSLKEFLSELRRNITQPAYLGLMIQLFTGLSASEVCGLTVDSIETSSHVSGMLIKITQEMTETGGVIAFDEVKKYRWMPCIDILAPYLARRVDHILSISKKHTKPYDLLLLTDYNRVDEGDGGKLKPRELRKLSRQLLQIVGITPHIIRLQDEGLRDKETNLNQYYGEILTSNFEFYARHKLGLLPGEYSYLAGNNQDFVKDASYVDYANIHSQNRIRQKLNKWSRILK